MSDLNTLHNRAVWFDIPVAELKRAADFYSAMLAVKVDIFSEAGFSFAVIEHSDGNGGCLVPNPADISNKGVMLYLNVNGRIQDAVAKVNLHGGKVLQAVHAIGPHGFRAVVIDSEGNRVVLHSETDA
ncbi:VOC family protein [Rheinheimera aquimaris]|jgi:predicted enzyme related to lactoylglutathione lyase|uniref:VOC family protein n=1 Tax=Rheinheimera aquimaris TaxID=412437 RepID=UPI000E815F83|nr:VOC family protein [Rheinheimera aquimaris]HBN90279.1 VOC family protein [Rheinheimera sp.]|tara:strand:+ start:3837 stop:4220 length:384 start_codon:yes stop_codon:yes gene_type:complete